MSVAPKTRWNSIQVEESDPEYFTAATGLEDAETPSPTTTGIEGATEGDMEMSSKRRIIILIVFWIGMFFVFASITCPAPFYPKEARMKGASPTQSGIVIGVFDLGILIAVPVISSLSHRVKPKAMLVGGLFLAGATNFIFGFTHNIPGGKGYLAVAFLIRIINGFGTAAFQVTSFIVIAMIFSSRLGTAFSVLETAVGLGFLTGPAVGGSLYELSGFLLPFAIMGICLVSAGILIFFVVPPIGTTARDPAFSLRKFILHVHPFLCSCAVASSELLSGFLAGALEPYVEQFHIRAAYVGMIFVAEGAAYAATSPMWGYLNDKGLDPLYCVLVGFTLGGVGYFFIAPSSWLPIKPSLGLTIGAIVVCGLAEAATIINSYNAMTAGALERGYPDDRRTYGLVSAIFNMACSVGAFVGPVGGGFVAGTIGFRPGSMSIVAVELILAIAFISYIIWRRVKGLPKKVDVPTIGGKLPDAEKI